MKFILFLLLPLSCFCQDTTAVPASDLWLFGIPAKRDGLPTISFTDADSVLFLSDPSPILFRSNTEYTLDTWNTSPQLTPAYRPMDLYFAPQPLDDSLPKWSRFKINYQFYPRITLEEPYDTSGVKTGSELSVQANDSTYLRLYENGLVWMQSGVEGFGMVDCSGDLFEYLSGLFKQNAEEKYELERKLEFYEDRYGKINGSLDAECVELLPAKYPVKYCSPKKKKK